jgi:branched-chain amino acid transport system ATP-binding protein
MLELEAVSASYGKVRALENVSLSVGEGQIVCILGANGAGKSTTLNCISGLVALTRGDIRFNGRSLVRRRAEQIVSEGIVQVPEGREIFATMSVADNLRLGTWRRKDRKHVADDLEWVFELFPRLKERLAQPAGTLSGGEQQMLMIGRALMARPRGVLHDHPPPQPSLGLSPILVQQVFSAIRTINSQGIACLVVEQNARVALDVASYGYVLENGEVVVHGSSAQLKSSARVQEAYLGSA